MRIVLAVPAALTLASGPALAAEGAFFSLANSDFVVLIAFLLFVGFLVYMKVPGLLGAKLDARAAGIRSELEEARALREEAKALLASYERKRKDAKAQADRIVAQAREDAAQAGEEARKELEASVARRLQAAEEQVASSQEAAIRAVRERAIDVAIAAARDVIARQITEAERDALVDSAITDVGAKLH